MRQLRARLGCLLRGHSPDPRTLHGEGPFEAECYFCRSDLEWSGE